APGQADAVRARLAGLGGVEVHAVADDGRMIVTIETDSDGETVSAFDAINKADGVMSASMVYHQTESDPDKEV
ncbi:MAG TPA: chaperone NapD, partial [Rhodocyclaceae bacterium]|nr:chaperone NapD [Rhodocyclaceae bacterium]